MRKFVKILSVLILFCGSATFAQLGDAPLGTATVKVKKARLRVGPGLDNPIRGVLVKGHRALVVDEQKGWYRLADEIDADKDLGWMSGKLLDVVMGPVVVGDAEVVEEPAAEQEKDVLNMPDAEFAAEQAPEGDEKSENDGEPAQEETGDQAEQTKETEEKPAQTPAAEQKSDGGDEQEGGYEGYHGEHAPHDSERVLSGVKPHKGRGYFLQISPAFNSVAKDRGGTIESTAFRGIGEVGVELFYDIYLTAAYNFVGYRPGEPTHEVIGSLRYQPHLFWRLHPHLSYGLGYSTFQDDDNLVMRGSLGLNINLGGQPYDVLMGPLFEWNQILLPGEDLQSWVLGFSMTFFHSIPD